MLASPTCRWPRRNSPSRCCSAASSIRWPAPQSRGGVPVWTDLVTLLAAWVSFGLFTITCGALVALHADRLAHRRRHAVMTNYFEHILQLPLSFHGGIHSGRLMKVMLTGTDSLWWLWLGFFREHLAAFVSLLVLLPLSLMLNWRLALLLIALCVVFAGLTALVLRKAEAGQSAVERHYGDLAERASDALGNVALVQSYSRIEAEVSGLRERRRQAARRADAGAVVVGDLRGADARLDDADRAFDLRGRHLAQHPRPDHGRRDRHLHELRRHADHPARAGGGLRQPAVPWTGRG